MALCIVLALQKEGNVYVGFSRLASENREKADYLDFFIASREEAEKQIQRAENFLESIKLYLMEQQIL